MKHLPYFLLVAASLSFIPVAADASELESWRFDSNQNQLEFTTDEDVQPKAQLIADPTRLVIDLPGIVLGRPAFTEPVSGSTIRSVRIGQFDRQTTRIVIELAPGYTLDPNQVRFRGITARQWTVQLPTPQRLPTASQPPSDTSTAPSTPRPTIGAPARAATQFQGVRVTPDGLFVRTNGNPPEISVSRSENRRQIAIDFQGTAIAATAQRDFLVNRYGVNRVQVTQLQTSPPVVRLTLNVAETSPDWQASVSNLGGVVLVPSGGVTAATTESRPSSQSSSSPPSSNQLATISSVELESSGTQLVIRADQPLQFTTGWDRPTGYYRITINAAKLAPQLKGPKLDTRSPILRLRLRQEDARTVAILVQPAAGVQVREVNQPSQQVLALQLQRRTAPGISGNPSTAAIPVPTPPRTAPAAPDLPRVPNGRLVVIVDPGHGGPDPGAVGIGGLQEKEIVLDIGRQVAALLERQGVQAILTRSDDRDLDLEPRVRMAEQANATIFVSIHANSIDLSRPDINGIETYYHQSGAALARTIHASILQDTGARDRGVRQARFYVLRRTSMPSVLVEVGFVTGRDDAAQLSSSAYRSQMAAAIARGILQYLQRS